MKIKLNDLLIISFLILISFVLKEIQFVSIIIAVLLIFFGAKIDSGIKNLAYLAIATIPFVPFFIFFIFYIPFIIFGTIFENASFIKKYLFGLSVTIVLRLTIYHLSTLHIQISAYLIAFQIFIFLVAAYIIYIKKNGISSIKNLFSVSGEEYKILLITLFFLSFVTNVMYNGTSMYGSNGTQIYTKQLFVIDIINKFHFFPLYDPGIGMGEQLFLTDSPAHFTKDILILATTYLKTWFNAVLVYNAYEMFILWMVILGVSLLLKEILSTDGKNNSDLTVYFIILGSLAIGLSFQFVRLLESFKSFSAQPINYLLLASIFAKPKKAAEWFAICYLMLFSYMVHVIQSFGIFLIGMSLVFVLYIKDKASVSSAYKYILKNKFKVIFAILLFIGIMAGYTATGYMYSAYLREYDRNRVFYPDPVGDAMNYIHDFFVEKNTTPFSLSYPDVQRLDTKQGGLFLTVMGGISFMYVIFSFKGAKLKKTRIFNYAYLLHFLLTVIIIHIIYYFGTLEYSYRIVLPFSVVVLVISTCAFFDSFSFKKLESALLLLFFIVFFYSVYYGLSNFSLSNIAWTKELVGLDIVNLVVLPYSIILSVILALSLFNLFSFSKIKAALLALFFIFLFHSLFYVRVNLANIHSESVISEGALKDETEFARKLPVDGRIITYGFFSNAVDAGMASVSGRYFTRYQYNLWSEMNNIYEKVHTQQSFGEFPRLENISGIELRNYYIMGGYKYLFINICHPVGQLVTVKMYPNYSTALYQNQCFVFLKVNNATYADKVSVLKNVGENVYKNNIDGYNYISISNLTRYKLSPGNFIDNAPSVPIEPVELSFTRVNPQEVIINGDFKNNDWVTFKEEYFPRWKAYMNNIEVPVYPTNLNMILVKTMNGNSILLKYDMTNAEKVFSFISLLAAIVCAVIFILFLKKDF